MKQEDNKLIAEFMEVKFYPHKLIAEFRGVKFDKGTSYNMGYDIFSNGNLYRSHELKYHKSWDWLRPVVKKIDAYANEEMSFNEFDNYRDKYVFIHDLSVHNDIKDIYNQVVEFIKEYNDGRKQ
tara:strand:+ start:221 stop:592 length:372 start_codon:yes stop_codon:yes gene_type:complete